MSAMKSRLAVLAALVLVHLSLAPAVRAAELMHEIVVGPLPLPRPLTYEEHETFTRLVNFGVVKQQPQTIQDPAKAELVVLPANTVAEVLRSFGGSADKLPAPSGMLSAVSPGYPRTLKEGAGVASARCQFEVLPDGSVGRIFSTQFTQRDFVLECGRALKRWRFPAAANPRHFQILFEAKP
jgi:hypothetical protein